MKFSRGGVTRRLTRLVAIAMALVATACERAPVSRELANRYQQAVYFNVSRQRVDRKRDLQRKPAEVMAFAGVQPGMTVVDLCGGDGWYAELLGSVVGANGKVYVVNPTLFTDIAGEALKKRLRGNRLPNVVSVEGTWQAMNIPANADMIWLALAYHDIYVQRPDKPVWQAERDSFFAQMRAALKPGGLLLVIDHAAPVGSLQSASQKLHRIDEEFALRDISAAGFEFVAKSGLLRNPQDDYSKSIWADGTMGQTDQFVHLYRKAL
jgi:predicted methyltransferase